MSTLERINVLTQTLEDPGMSREVRDRTVRHIADLTEVLMAEHTPLGFCAWCDAPATTRCDSCGDLSCDIHPCLAC